MGVKLKLDADKLKQAADRMMEVYGAEAVGRAMAKAITLAGPFATNHIANVVSTVYNIAPAAVMSSSTKGRVMSASVSAGADGAFANLVYTGRTMTMQRFGFTPRSQPAGKKYRVATTVFRGRPVGHAPNVFIPRGAKITVIPFKRTTKSRFPIDAVHTLSVPQMISNADLEEQIVTPIGEHLVARFAEQFLSREA